MTIDIDHYCRTRLDAISDSVHIAYRNAVEGDVAEFGIGQGESLEVIAETMAQCDRYTTRFNMPTKRLHGFDSFVGFPRATVQGDIDAPMVIHNVWGKPKVSPGTAAIRGIVEERIAPSRLTLYPGFFAETMKTIPPDVKFACVNIDCDMYVSTRDVLEELFGNDRLSDGCVLMFDDFIENRAAKNLGQRKAWRECKAKYAPDVTDLGMYALAGWRFIVHKGQV